LLTAGVTILVGVAAVVVAVKSWQAAERAARAAERAAGAAVEAANAGKDAAEANKTLAVEAERLRREQFEDVVKSINRLTTATEQHTNSQLVEPQPGGGWSSPA
jgi:hypothetical protein